MKCPHCGAGVPDGALSCPACRTALDVTQKISLGDATWCPSCGALVAPGEQACPKCGSSLVPEDPVRPTRDLDLPEIGNTGMMDALDSGETGVMTRIESAIPPEGDESSRSALRDRIPRPRSFALAALLAVVVVGGAAVLITHPWDPTATQTKATTPADTSMSGFPGILESLTGQDVRGGSDGEGTEQLDAFSVLESSYESLSALSERVDASEESLRDVGVSGDDDARSKGLSDAQAISLEVSNLISQVGMLDDGGGAYSDDISNVITLGNWLRNRCDALTEAWQRSVDAADPAASASSILAPVEGSSDYARLFSENYDAWKPEQAS
ncbi:MAG TPA: hypothetical protein DD645_03945 [Olsenella sp.]|nr:hypothetical protein [Olsenella sp.]